MKDSKLQDNKGFTLLELVIVIAILSFILLAIVTFQISGTKAFSREATTTSNQLTVRRVSNEIGRELRRASSITESSGLLTLTYPDGKRNMYYLDDTTIKANYYSLNPYGILQLDDTGKLAQGIKQFAVTVLADQVNIEIESLENSEGITYKLETEITIRR